MISIVQYIRKVRYFSIAYAQDLGRWFRMFDDAYFFSRLTSRFDRVLLSDTVYVEETCGDSAAAFIF